VELTIKVRIAKRKLGAAEANPATVDGPTPTEQSLAKLVQLLADRNKAEKDWMSKETIRHAAEVKAAQSRVKDAEERTKQEMKMRLVAESERQLQEKREVLKRLPGELADVDLRLRAAELKRDQTKLELDAAAREIDRIKAGKAQLADLKARLEKELKSTGDK